MLLETANLRLAAHLSLVIDSFDGRPVAWSIGARPSTATGAPTIAGWAGKRPASAPGSQAACRARGCAATTPAPRGSSACSSRDSPAPPTGRGPHGRTSCGSWTAGSAGSGGGRISQALGWRTPDEHRLALEYAVQTNQQPVQPVNLAATNRRNASQAFDLQPYIPAYCIGTIGKKRPLGYAKGAKLP